MLISTVVLVVFDVVVLVLFVVVIVVVVVNCLACAVVVLVVCGLYCLVSAVVSTGVLVVFWRILLSLSPLSMSSSISCSLLVNLNESI